MMRWIVVTVVVAGLYSEPAVLPTVGIGEKVPLGGVRRDILTGAAVDLDAYIRGRERTVVFLWTTWCATCRAKTKDFNEIHDRIMRLPSVGLLSFSSDGVFDIGTRPRASLEDVAEYARGLGMRFPVFYDDGNLNLTRGVRQSGFPGLYWIDSDARVLASFHSEGGATNFLERIDRELGALEVHGRSGR